MDDIVIHDKQSDNVTVASINSKNKRIAMDKIKNNAMFLVLMRTDNFID